MAIANSLCNKEHYGKNYDTAYSRKMSHVNRDTKNDYKTLTYSGLKMG